MTDNTAYDNLAGAGIVAGTGSTVTGNVAYGNGDIGIAAGLGSTVTGNTAYGNGRNGIYLAGNCLVDQNTAYNNDQSVGGYANISACASCTFGLNHAP